MKIRSFILFNFFFLTYVCAQTFNTSSITSDLDYTQKILPVDLDSDGEVDVLYASEQGDLLGVLKNDGLENFTNLEIKEEDGSITDIEVSDLDNDGDLDIISIGWTHGRVLLYENKTSFEITCDTRARFGNSAGGLRQRVLLAILVIASPSRRDSITHPHARVEDSVRCARQTPSNYYSYD